MIFLLLLWLFSYNFDTSFFEMSYFSLRLMKSSFSGEKIDAPWSIELHEKLDKLSKDLQIKESENELQSEDIKAMKIRLEYFENLVSEQRAKIRKLEKARDQLENELEQEREDHMTKMKLERDEFESTLEQERAEFESTLEQERAESINKVSLAKNTIGNLRDNIERCETKIVNNKNSYATKISQMDEDHKQSLNIQENEILSSFSLYDFTKLKIYESWNKMSTQMENFFNSKKIVSIDITNMNIQQELTMSFNPFN